MNLRQIWRDLNLLGNKKPPKFRWLSKNIGIICIAGLLSQDT